MDDTHSRRDFIKVTAAAGTLAAAGLRAPGVHAAGSDEIRVGLIGCGGRGTGAVANVVDSAKGVRLIAVGDAFADRIEAARKRWTDLDKGIAVPDENCFRRPRRLREGHRVRRQLHHPRHSSRLPPGSPEGRGGRRQDHLHREASGRRRPWHPPGPGRRGRGREQGAGHWCRHPEAAPEGLHRGDEAGPRRRHRRPRERSRLLETRGVCGTRGGSGAGPIWNGRSATGSTSPGSPGTTSSSSTSTTSTS